MRSWPSLPAWCCRSVRLRPSSSPSFPAPSATTCRFFATCSTSTSRRPATRSRSCRCRPSTTDQFGQYKLWLAAQNADIDVYRTDVIWAPQLANQLVDLTEATKDVVKDHFPSIIESQTVNGKLVALPMFTDAPALYYRKDLLDKYGAKVPTTWKEMADTAKMIMDKERAAGNKDMWGFVFQGNAYEGLTCDALEWVKSNGGGQIVEPDGVDLDQQSARPPRPSTWSRAGSAPSRPPGVLAYQEEESRGVWQTGNAVFMRNWPYAYALGNGADFADQGQVRRDHAPDRSVDGARSAATLGGWNLAVSKYSKNPEAAIELVKYLASAEMQKDNALRRLEPADHPGALRRCRHRQAQQPIIPRWKEVFLNAVPRPSAPTSVKYNEVSSQFWTAVHETLVRQRHGRRQPQEARRQAEALKGGAW